MEDRVKNNNKRNENDNEYLDEEVEIAGVYTTCPECGKPINFDNDGGNGFCKDCAPNH